MPRQGDKMIIVQDKVTGMFTFVNEEDLINLEGNYVEVVNHLTTPYDLAIF